MARIKGRSVRESTGPTVLLYARVSPEVKAIVTRSSKTLGVSEVQFLEELLRRAEAETPEGVPTWVLEQFRAQKAAATQLEMGMSA